MNPLKLISHIARVRHERRLAFLVLFLGLLLVTAVAASAVIVSRIRGIADEEIIRRAGKLMALPSDPPMVIPMEAGERLAQLKERWPDFYQNATSGDRLLQFQGRAVLYRPKENKIMNIQASRNGVFLVEKIERPLLIEIRYVAGEEGRAYQFAREIEENAPAQFQIIAVRQSNVPYEGDVMYEVNPLEHARIDRFATLIGGSPVLDRLEPREAPTEADAIVAFRRSPR